MLTLNSDFTNFTGESLLNIYVIQIAKQPTKDENKTEVFLN